MRCTGFNTEAMMQSKGLLYMSILLVAFLAIWLAIPPRELDWQDDIVPLAHQKMGLTTTTETPLEGMIVVLTGATSGIGLALTKTLAKLGATVIAIGRSQTKLAKLEQQVKGVEAIVADLNDLQSVAKAANDIQERFQRIDTLICNAGMHYKWAAFDHPQTPQGYDQVFAVNYLSHFLLTEKMIPLLKNSTMPTLIEISSSYHWAVDGSDLVSTDGNAPVAAQPGGTPLWFWRDQRAYANSKLAQILNMRALQRQDGLSDIRMTSVCPGWVATQIAGQPGTLLHSLLDNFAFDANGWGMASTLYALLNSTDDKDFYVNSNFHDLFHYLTPLLSPPIMYRLGLRDLLSAPIAFAMLPGQALTANAYGTTSSPESYNETLQDSLYKWSKDAVFQYL